MHPLLDTDRPPRRPRMTGGAAWHQLGSFSSVTTDHAARYDPRPALHAPALAYGPRRSMSRVSGWERAAETTSSAASISAIERSLACSSASSSASS
jgi:hypothetical protein